MSKANRKQSSWGNFQSVKHAPAVIPTSRIVRHDPEQEAAAETKRLQAISARNRALHKATTRVTNACQRGSYDGAELRPFDARKGAMDAYKLPSKGL